MKTETEIKDKLIQEIELEKQMIGYSGPRSQVLQRIRVYEWVLSDSKEKVKEVGLNEC